MTNPTPPAVTAQKLRDAAARIRETAQAATPGPWITWAGVADDVYTQGVSPASDLEGDAVSAPQGPQAADDHEHIAMWSPPVALAVADWLDAEAGHVERLAVQATVLNAAIKISDGEGESREWRISLGYSTLEQATTVADLILGGDR